MRNFLESILGVLLFFLIVVIITFFIEPQCNSSSELHKAVRENNYNQVVSLLENGYDVNVQDSKSLTPLHYAILQNSSIEIIEKLIEYGADVNAKTIYKVIPLHFAAQRGDTTIAKLLISNGFIIDTEDEKGLTPLLWIVGRDWASNDMIELLELHTDALIFWQGARSEQEYIATILMLLLDKESRDKFNKYHYIKRSDKELKKYIKKLLTVRGSKYVPIQ